MHILAASVDYFPGLGGVSLLTHHVSNALVDAGAEVSLVVPPGGVDDGDWPRRYELIIDHHARPGLIEGPEFAQSEIPRLNQFLHEYCERRPVDRLFAFHAHYYGQLFVRFGRQSGIPASVMIHGTELRHVLQWPAIWRGIQKVLQKNRPMHELEMLKLVRGADEVICNSPYTAGLVSLTGRTGPVHVSGCGVSSDDLKRSENMGSGFRIQARAHICEMFGIPVDAPIIGYVGRIAQSKNLELILQTAKTLPDLNVLLVGVGPHEEALKSLIRDLGIETQIFWAGRTGEENKWPLLAAMDVFCLVSQPMPNGDIEGFGIAALEAAIAGTPVIGSRTGGIPFVVQHEVTGLLLRQGADEADLAQAIGRFRNEPDLRAKCVSGARDQLKASFNWPHIANTLRQRWEKQGAGK